MRHDTAPARLSRDEELVLLASLLEGKNGAWRSFHTHYDRLIYRCIRKVTRSFSAVRDEDEKEIYANLLVQLLSHDMRKLRSFDPERGSRLGTWLGLLATHAAYDYLRAIRREVPRVPLFEAEAASDDTASPFDLVQRREHAGLVERLVEQLSAKDRQFLKLYFRDGLSAERVAEHMNISVKTVYSKKHKIRARLESFVSAVVAA